MLTIYVSLPCCGLTGSTGGDGAQALVTTAQDSSWKCFNGAEFEPERTLLIQINRSYFFSFRAFFMIILINLLLFCMLKKITTKCVSTKVLLCNRREINSAPSAKFE